MLVSLTATPEDYPKQCHCCVRYCKIHIRLMVRFLILSFPSKVNEYTNVDQESCGHNANEG